MKKIICKIFLIVLLGGVGNCHAATAKKPLIAVFDFKNVMSWKSRSGSMLSLLLMTKLSTYDSIELVERKQIDKILKERKLARSGLARNEYFKIAALLNADYIVTGRMYKDEDEEEITVNLRLTKCADGKIQGKSFFVPLTKKDEYLEKIAKKAAAFIAKSFDKKVKTQPASKN